MKQLKRLLFTVLLCGGMLMLAGCPEPQAPPEGQPPEPYPAPPDPEPRPTPGLDPEPQPVPERPPEPGAGSQ
jgi:hypothetical protein